jgi:hypothetical protein
MATKKDADLTPMEFCHEVGVLDALTIDGSMQQDAAGTEFMKNYRKNDIRVTGTVPECPNQNPAEGDIREVRRKWFRAMIRTTKEASQSART